MSSRRLKICVMGNARSVHIQRWAVAYADRDHEVYVLSIRHADIPGALVRTVCIGPINSSSIGWTFLSYLRMLRSARKHLQELAPDVVHAHYTLTYGVIAAFSGFHPWVLSTWGADVIWDGPGKMPWLFRLLNRYAVQRADLLSATSKFMLHRVRDLVPALVSAVHIPFGVDTERFHPISKDPGGTEQQEFRIGFVKALRPKYGPELLLRAMPGILREVANARLILAGRGPLKEKLLKLLYELGLAESAEFVGFVPNDQVPRLMRTFDVFVNCSICDSESFGVSILEASACGVAVVATRVGGVPEVCIEGQTGVLVEPGDSEALVAAIISLAKGPDRRRALGRRGREFVVATYTWRNSVDTMLNHFLRLVG